MGVAVCYDAAVFVRMRAVGGACGAANVVIASHSIHTSRMLPYYQ